MHQVQPNLKASIWIFIFYYNTIKDILSKTRSYIHIGYSYITTIKTVANKQKYCKEKSQVQDHLFNTIISLDCSAEKNLKRQIHSNQVS